MGISTLTKPAGYYGLSLAIGTAEVRPVEMASAYATLANQGVHQTLTAFIKVTNNSTGKVLYDFTKDHPDGKQAVDPQIAYEMSNIFSDNASRTPTFGARSALYFSDRLVAAKTGTTQENRDCWTCGYTPSLATAVWTGNNMPSPMKTDAVIIAGPIFHEFMSKALAGTPAEDFKKPDGIQTVTVDKYSNKLPDQYTTETTTDIFSTWQTPKDKENIYKQVTVCKGTSLIAPDGTDPSLIETKVFADLHSEKPNDPNWEGPVRAWAQANGLAVPLPTGTCDITSMTPTISFASPTNGLTVTGQSTITVTVSAPNGAKDVTYFIDDVQIGQSTSSPFSLPYDFDSISAGSHKLSAQITDNNGMTAKTDIQISISQTGITISGLSATPSATSVTITWTTSVAGDSTVYYTVSGGTAQQQTSGTMTTNHTVTISGLLPGKSYTFTAASKDANNNPASADGTFSIPK
jgi:membrane carboxypeptidase/penicillin-binding protein PbpC